MKILLISNSTMSGEPYLDYPKHEIKKFLGDTPVTAILIPYASIILSYDEYCERVDQRFSEVGHHVIGLHTFADPVKAINNAEAIIIGDGNTWQLVRKLHDMKLINPIREKVFNGTPYIGWSAGTNVACPTMRTTNDMPVIEPRRLDCVGLVPFQINPHYLDSQVAGHAGETREQRILEYIELYPETYVVGLREGTMLKLEDEKLCLIGNQKCRIFKKGKDPAELSSCDDLSFLMESGFLSR